jgi:ATP-binding cassette subfamily F protein uup
MRQRRAALAAAAKPAAARGDRRESQPRPQPRRLGFAQLRELEALPGRIEAREAEQVQLTEAAGRPELYRRDASEQGRVHARLAELLAELDAAYARWAELEAQKTI